jgi:type II secretory pathway component GspD/PulD (secretin)
MKRIGTIFGMFAALLLSGASAWAQAAPATDKPVNWTTETYYFANVGQQQEMNELITALRNVVEPKDRLTLVPSQNAIVMWGPPDQLTLAKKVLSDLDKPRKTYRLTYTVRDMDDNKQIGIQHFSLIVVSGARTTLKSGSKVPIATGSTSTTNTNEINTQFTYVDIGLSIDASLDESASGVRLRTRLERSSVVEEKSMGVVQEPLIRSTVLEGTSILTQGKQAVLGSLDVPGSTRHLDVEVSLAVVP